VHEKNLSSDSHRQIIRYNFVANAADGALFSFAMSFVSLTTVIPLLVKRIGGSNIAIGMIPVFWTIGFNFPQISIANYAHRFPFKKTLMIRTALLQRIPWLLLSFCCFFCIGRMSVQDNLLLFFICFFMAAVGGSLNLPGWFDLIAKVTPTVLRGRLFAVRMTLGALLGILGGWYVKHILDSVSYPNNFGILFLIAFFIMMVSYIFLLAIREEEPNYPSRERHYIEFIKQLPVILKTEHNYRRFLIADASLTAALMADAFYMVHVVNKYSLSEGWAGRFTMVMMGSLIAGNFCFGFLADKFGHRVNLIIAAFSTVGACLTTLFALNVTFYAIVFVGAAFTIGLIQVSRLSMIAEVCGEKDRPTYIALTNMVTSPFILSGILGGWVADQFGYKIVFILAGLFALFSGLWMILLVDEPRTKKFSVASGIVST